MKILHVIFSFLTGGAETMLVDIVNEQASRGHEVELLIVNSGVDEEILSHVSQTVTITKFNRTEGSMPLLLMVRLNLFALRRNPDIIHLHTHKLTGLLRVRRSTTVYTVHDLRTPMTYCYANHMAAISDAVKEDVLARVKNAKIRVISNGINLDTIERRHENTHPNTFHIVQVARLFADKKGQDILIDALAQLLKRGYQADITFIGEGRDLEMLQQQAEQLGIADKVHFTGNLVRKEVYSTLKNYDLMCHPSRFEGFGLTIAEGMAAGLPLALPEGGGPWEVADRGRLCESFISGNATSCADAIARIIDNYPAALKRADEAIKHVDAKYSVSRMVSDYERYYTDLISNR